MSRVTAIISVPVICIIVCPSRAVNHYRDNAITYKAQRDKNARELGLANAKITDMQMRQRDAAALDAKYTKERIDAKAENDVCVMMLPLVVVGCTSKQSVSQCVKPPPPPAWIMQPPPDWQTPLNGIISPSERLITMQKQPEGTHAGLMSSADRAAHITGNSCNYCEQYTRASSGV